MGDRRDKKVKEKEKEKEDDESDGDEDGEDGNIRLQSGKFMRIIETINQWKNKKQRKATIKWTTNNNEAGEENNEQ